MLSSRHTSNRYSSDSPCRHLSVKSQWPTLRHYLHNCSPQPNISVYTAKPQIHRASASRGVIVYSSTALAGTHCAYPWGMARPSWPGWIASQWDGRLSSIPVLKSTDTWITLLLPTTIAQSHQVLQHQYADDMQLYVALSAMNYSKEVDTLQSHLSSIHVWFSDTSFRRHLKMYYFLSAYLAP